MTMRKRRGGWWLPPMVLGLLGLFPSEARADAFTVELALLFGGLFVLPVILFLMVVESVCLARGLRISAASALGLALGMNLASLAAGLPVLIVNGVLDLLLLPRQLAGYLRVYPRLVVLGVVVYFAATLLVEVGVVEWWRRRRSWPVGFRRVAGTVLLANLATYAVLVPLGVRDRGPRHDFRELTDDTSWALSPAVTVYYLDNRSQLSAIDTAGRGRRVLVPDAMRDYQFAADESWFLYHDRQKALRFCRAGGEPQTCRPPRDDFDLTQVACDPQGTRVAYLQSEEFADWKPGWRLYVWEAATERTLATNYWVQSEPSSPRQGDPAGWPELAWSTTEDVLFVQRPSGVVALCIDPDATVRQLDPDEVSPKLFPVYGRFRNAQSRLTFDGGPLFVEDHAGEWTVIGDDGMLREKPNLEVSQRGVRQLVLDDRSMWNFSSSRILSVRDVGFVQSGRELLFDDYRGLYLLNVEQRRLGWLTSGRDWVVPTPRYQRRLAGLAEEL
jgi:hypothetical protein